MITKVVIYLAILAFPTFPLSQGPEGASANSSPSSSQLPDAPAAKPGRIPEISDRRADPSSAEQEPNVLLKPRGFLELCQTSVPWTPIPSCLGRPSKKKSLLACRTASTIPRLFLSLHRLELR